MGNSSNPFVIWRHLWLLPHVAIRNDESSQRKDDRHQGLEKQVVGVRTYWLSRGLRVNRQYQG